jgi:hypothetical protein
VSKPSGTYLDSTGKPVGMQDARSAWVPIARESLLRTAETYNAFITYKDLAEEVQNKSGIRTNQLVHYWIGKVLGVVSNDCYRSSEPLLSSLCVHQDGSVGAGYGAAFDETYGGARPADMDLAAAEERLKCYRHFGATMPADGGQPLLTRRAPTRVKRSPAARTRMVNDEVRAICPQCHVRLPSSGVCGSHE